MQTNAFFGGRPNIAVRIMYAAVAALALAIAIWDLLPLREGMTHEGHQVVDVLHTATMFTIAGISAVQAFAPVRFAWPGWIVLAAAVLPGSAGSLTWAVDSLTYRSGFRPPTDFVVQLLLLPAFYSLALVGALVAWHVQPVQQARAATYAEGS